MTTTIGALYKEGAASLAAAGVNEADHDARVLMAHVLDLRPNDVLLKLRDPLAPSEERLIRELLHLRQGRMPLRYVTRTTYFAGLDLRTDDRALVPRHETELLVEAVLERLPQVGLEPTELLADIGCGAGGIGLALASRTPGLRVVLTDISEPAVELAGENARFLGLAERVTLLAGSYLEPVFASGLADRVGVLVCNPPYVRPNEMGMLDPEVHAEPRVAVTSPARDGLEGYRVLTDQIGRLPHLRLLGVEVGYAQETDVADMFAPFGEVEILPDLSGIERVVILHVR
ncbi:peptide chain release factor N(5)-glutamine methyltransferase [bacterium]|nr:peptide chain release factor N(5)-glutamine methyltransferase [bacterium]